MSERVDIANQALTFLGAPTITGFEDETPEALLVRTHYPPSRDALLEAGEWSFATREFTPAQLTDAPLRSYDYQFMIPAECMRVTGVFKSEDLRASQPLERSYTGAIDDERQVRHKIIYSGRHLVIQADYELICRGIFRPENEGVYSASFASALAMYLAYRLAIPLTESNSKRDAAMNMYLVDLKKAQTMDGMGNTSRRLRTNHIVGAR